MDNKKLAGELVRLAKVITGGRLDEVDIGDLIDFAKAYNEMGWAVQEQFHKLIDGDSSGLNPNAVDVMERKLGRFHSDVKSAIDRYKKFDNEGDE